MIKFVLPVKCIRFVAYPLMAFVLLALFFRTSTLKSLTISALCYITLWDKIITEIAYQRRVWGGGVGSKSFGWGNFKSVKSTSGKNEQSDESSKRDRRSLRCKFPLKIKFFLVFFSLIFLMN